MERVINYNLPPGFGGKGACHALTKKQGVHNVPMSYSFLKFRTDWGTRYPGDKLSSDNLSRQVQKSHVLLTGLMRGH